MADRLISADRLKRKYAILGAEWSPKVSFEAVLRDIDNQPTVDAEPVKRGRWINERIHNLHNGEQRDARECSECGAVYFVYDMANALDEVPRYCPNCGAKMEGVIEDD